MLPVEFEIWVRRYLEEQGAILKEFRTEHLENLHGTDGNYIMDVTARFEALGVSFLVLIECKRYTSDPVEREQIQALNQKLLATGAQKAIVFTTSTFRQGAVDFARVHGIGLVEVIEEGV
jgi:restriction system protein